MAIAERGMIMTLRDTIAREIESVAEYMAMLYSFSGHPVVFEYNANGKKYNMTLTEVVEEPVVVEENNEVVDSAMESI